MAVLPRSSFNYENVRIGDQPLPSQFVRALSQDQDNFYDLRDYILNLFIDDETPAGPLNGTNTTFTLAATPLPQNSLELYRNGVLLNFGFDYTLTGNTIVLAVAPLATDTLLAYYRQRSGVASISAGGGASVPSGGGGGGGGGGPPPPNLWTLTGNFLYPTTLSNIVLTGITSTDLTLPNGSLVALNTFAVVSAAASAHVLALSVSSGTEATVSSTFTGASGFLPLSFYTAGARRFTITSSGTATGVLLGGIFSTDLTLASGSIVSAGVIACVTATTNASVLAMNITAGTETTLASTLTGTGTFLPLSFYTGGARRVTITTTGDLLAGFLTSDAAGGPGRILASTLVGTLSASANSPYIFMQANAGGVENILESTKTGTGATLPLSFYVFPVGRSGTFDTNGALLIGMLSSDGSAFGRLIASDRVEVVSATLNASTIFLNITPAVTVNLQSGVTGTGTCLPLAFFTCGSEWMRILTNGRVLIGRTTEDGTGSNLQVNGNVSAGGIVLGANFWTRTSGNIYPSVSTDDVLVGMTSSDAAGGIGRILASTLIGVVSSPTNSPYIFMQANTGGVENILESTATGIGAQLPLSFYVAPTGRAVTIATTGDLLVGFLTNQAAGGLGRIIASTLIGVTSAATNSPYIFMQANTGGVENILESTRTGTGAQLPLSFYVAPTGRVATFTTGGQVFFLRFASAGVGATMQLTGNFEASALNNAFGFDGTTAQATGAALLVYQGFQVHSTGAANFSFLAMQCDTSNNLSQITSGHVGSGANLPLTFNVGGGEAARFTTDPAFLVGLTSSDIVSPNRVILGERLYCVTAATNASTTYMGVTGGSESFLAAGITGTGTYLPLSFYTSNTRRVAVDTSGTVILGGALSTSIPNNGRLVTAADFIVTTAYTGAMSIIDILIASSLCQLRSDGISGGSALPIAFVVGGTIVAELTSAMMLVGLSSTDVGSVLGTVVAGFRVYAVTAAANASVIFLGTTAGTEVFLSSNITGAGTQLPLSIFVAGNRIAKFISPGVIGYSPLTFAQLPAGVEGMTAFVTDANSNVFTTAIAGGGTSHVPVYFGSGAWRVG